MFDFLKNPILKKRIADVELSIKTLQTRCDNIELDISTAKKKKVFKNDKQETEEGAIVFSPEEAAELRSQLSALGINLPKE